MMLKAIVNKTLLSISVLAILSTANLSFAADASAQHHRHNVVDRKSEKVKTGSGFTHTVSKTDDKGATSSRRTDVVIDKEAGTRTRNITGNTFDGKTYSDQSTSHKTETGYVSQGHVTTSDGKVIDRTVNATVDKSAGTITKNISVTPQGGETTTKTVVHSLKRSHEH